MSDYVQAFDNMDEMMATMAASEDAANRGLTPGQTRLRDDNAITTYWARPLPDMDLVVYGVVQPNSAFDDEDFDVAENRERGYLTGEAFSAWEPTGEHGDTHVSQVIPISINLFEAAREQGWPTFSMLREPDHIDLARALARAEMEARS